MLLMLGFFGLRFYQLSQFLKTRQPDTSDYFFDASHQLGPRGPVASGNSQTATDMASDMSKFMSEIRNLGFEQAEKKSLFDKRDQFKTYCALTSNHCVFLVHIPELRRFSQDAQDALAGNAWLAAQAISSRRCAASSEMQLAVGINGILSYERVMFGRYTPEASRTNSGLLNTERGMGCEKSLHQWFAPPTEVKSSLTGRQP